MKSVDRIKLLAGPVALAGARAACSSSSAPATTAASVSATSSATASSDATRSVTGTTGRSVQIPQNVTRVATNLPLTVPMIYAVGGIDKLVYQPSGQGTPLMAKIDPALAKAASAPTTSIGQAGGVNVAAAHGIGANKAGSYAFPTITAETLLSWNPDYIIGISAQVASLITSSPQFATLKAETAALPAGKE